MDKISRRELLRIGGLTAATALAAACAPQATPTAAPTSAPAPTQAPATSAPAAPTSTAAATARPATTVDWWTVGGADVGNQADQEALLAAFQKSPAGSWVTVKPTFLPDDGFSEKMTTVMATGAGAPDVTTINIADWFPQATDLTEYIARDKVDIGQYSKIHFDSRCRVGNLIIGLPIGVGATMYYYNKSLFDSKGLKYPEWGYTWDQFIQDAVKLTDRSKKVYGATMPTPIWRAQFFAFGALPFSQDGKTAAGYINGPNTVKAFQGMWDLAQSGAVPTPAEFNTLKTAGTGPLDLFNTGRLGFGPLNNGQFGIVDKAGVKFGLVHNPQVPGQEIITNGWTLQIGIPKASTKKDAAWEYVKWFTGQPGQRFLMERNNGFTPTIPALWKDHPAAKDDRWQFFFKILQTRQVWEFGGLYTYFSKVTRLTQDLYDRIYLGSVKREDIQKELDDIAPKAQQVIDTERAKLGLK